MNFKGKYSIRRKQVLMKGLSVSLLAVGLLAAGGCSLVNEDLPDCPPIQTDDSDKILLQFNMELGAALTRSDSYHDEEDSEWPYFEDRVYARDLGLFVFLGKGGGAPLIAKNTSIADSYDPYNMITGENGFYTITMSVERDEIEETLLPEVTSIDLRILVLANCYSPGENGGGDFSKLGANLRNGELPASTFSDIVTKAQSWGFDISEIYSGNEGDSQASGLWKGYIPMYGTNTFNVTRETLLRSTMGEQIYLGEVNLLRALAKVRVIDNIANKENGYPYISEVNVLSQTDMVYSLPWNAVNYNDGQQIHNDYHIHAKSDNKSYYEYKLGTLTQGGNTRIGYIAEQELNGAYPAFVIKVQENATDSKTYTVPMWGYNGEEFKFNDYNGTSLNYILRNHIYTLSVIDVATGGPLTLTLNVEDWNSEPIYVLDYMDIPVLAQPISWEEGTFYNNDSEKGELTINSFDEGNVTPAICTFRLDRPVNGVWTAHLITTEGVAGAFEFETTNSEGGTIWVESCSGVIDGTDATLKIIPTDVSPAQKNVAILQVSVTLADGTQMEANICSKDNQNVGYTNYQIIQNAK